MGISSETERGLARAEAATDAAQLAYPMIGTLRSLPPSTERCRGRPPCLPPALLARPAGSWRPRAPRFESLQCPHRHPSMLYVIQESLDIA